MLTKEQWDKVESNLSSPWGSVALLCDGYKITAVVERKETLKYVVSIYVNGSIKGEWFRGEAEEPKKFHRATKVYVHKASARARAKSELAKKRLPPFLKDIHRDVLEAHFFMWYPYWPNPKAFCRHIKKTCKSIEYVGDRHASY